MIKHVVVMLASVAMTAPLAAAPKLASAWRASWAASQQVPEPANLLSDEDFTDTTLRQDIRLSVGGRQLRVRLSNAFGTSPLTLDTVRVAVAGRGSSVLAGSGRTVTFDGRSSVVIPAGSDYWSDPVDLKVAALTRLAISFHYPAPPATQTGHPGSRSTSYVMKGGHSDDLDLVGAKAVEHWYQLAGVEVAAATASATVAAFGDSITDGHASTTDGDNRWPDVLAARLQADPATRAIGVVNEGIGGNHLLTDGLGPNALARFDRDVLSQAGIRFVIVLEGVNDLGGATREHAITPDAHAELVGRLIGAYAQIVARARVHGIHAIGATILPFGGSDYYHPDRDNEADRQKLNAWIRAPGHFDGVIDFDRTVRDPSHPDRMLPQYDCGDHLHPSVQGYRAMADAIPLASFHD